MTGICLPIDANAGVPAFPASQNRAVDAALALGRVDRALGAVSGYRPGADPDITITAARVWTATPSNGIIDPGTGPAVGPYRFAFLANESGTLDAADLNYTRYDRLDIQVPDDPPGAAPRQALYLVTKGVAAAQPAVPAAPARSFPVGVFTVPNSGNPSFAPTYPYCVASGAILPTRSGYRPANPFIGQYVDDSILGLMRWDGTAWRLVGVHAFDSGNRPANPYVGQYIDDADQGLMRYDGAKWVPSEGGFYDTDWLTGPGGPGDLIQGKGGGYGYINNYTIRRIGHQVNIYVEWHTQTQIGAGDFGNIDILQVNDARFIPGASSKAPSQQMLSAVGAGPSGSYSIGRSGTIQVASFAAALAANGNASVGGVYWI